MVEESTFKAAIGTHDGNFKYVWLPFGLVNAPGVFQQVINHIEVVMYLLIRMMS